MTAAKLPPYLDPRTAEILARAVRMLADADGNLNPNGTIKNSAGGRPPIRRAT